MSRSSYPGKGDSEGERTEGFRQLIAAILRRTLGLDALAQPPTEDDPAEDDDGSKQEEGQVAPGPQIEETEHEKADRE